jgi:hypothetical protein
LSGRDDLGIPDFARAGRCRGFRLFGWSRRDLAEPVDPVGDEQDAAQAFGWRPSVEVDLPGP